MRERPEQVTDSEVRAAVDEHWLPDAEAVAYLPVGFGAHHWQASVRGEPRLFVTLDELGDRHDLDQLHAAYAGAAALAAAGLEFVHAGLPPYAVGFGDGALSATPWCPGQRPDRLNPRPTDAMLARLHAATAPGVPRWRPLVGPDLADSLEARLRIAWNAGPFGARARAALRGRIRDIASWTSRYHALAVEAEERRWVPTHGEPHERNQLVSADGTVLVDWESLKLAPRERDLRVLLDVGLEDVDPDWSMVEMFDLEWRLDEISQYAAWFEGRHPGGRDDEVALGGLLDELDRPDWAQPGR